MLRLFARNVLTPRLLAVTPYITGADKCFFSNLLNRRRHAGKHAGTGVMPVLINKNGMTNQSGRDNNPLLNGRYQQEDEREYRQHQGQGRVPQYQRWHFAHCQRTGITTRFMLLPPRIPRFVATSTALLHFHCSTSLLYQRLLRPSLMGLGKWPSLINL